MNLRRSLQWLLTGCIALLFVLAVAKPIVLAASDLGRHLTNGRLFLDQGIIQTTNTYSYTHPDFPFLNHHWGSGVLFELARRVGGFSAVSFFGFAIVLATFLLFFSIAWRRGSHWLAIIAAIVVLPVFAGRAEIRPELFSYLFSGIFLWILLQVRSRALSQRFLLALPVLMLLWINLHIYFFLGIGFIGAFLIDALVRAWREPGERNRGIPWFLGILIATCAVTILNPNGWKGAVYPLLIFQNYAYAVAENQSVLAIERLTPYPPAFFFKVALAVVVLSWALRLYRDWRNREPVDLALLILSLFVSFVAWNAIRNFTIFSYVSIVAIAYAWGDVDWLERLERRWRMILQSAIPMVLCVILWGLYPSFWQSVVRTIGYGVPAGTLASIEFFEDHDLHGPIFNNYDIGGFLTYGLYPDERVFVDNRPEAYPGAFFTQTLLPMQSDDAEWLRVDALYQFQTIVFYRHDGTRGGQSFMIHRLQDPAWAPVFVDNFTIILVRRTPEFQPVIEEFELPKSMFQVKPR